MADSIEFRAVKVLLEGVCVLKKTTKIVINNLVLGLLIKQLLCIFAASYLMNRD
jgi:hypothetical protein